MPEVLNEVQVFLLIFCHLKKIEEVLLLGNDFDGFSFHFSFIMVIKKENDYGQKNIDCHRAFSNPR